MKNTLAAGFLALLVVGACRTGGGTSPYPERVRLPSLEDPYVLPTESCGNFFLAETRINGRGPFTLILDTGAGQTMLDPTVLDSADVRRGIDSLSIGEFTAFDVGYDRLDTHELSAALGRKIHGLLGHPVFAGALVTWDLPANQIVITPGELAPDGEDILATRSGYRPFVRSNVGGTSRWILLDTGSSRGLTLREPDALTMTSPLQPTGARVRVDGVHLVRSGRLGGPVSIGPIRVDDPVVNNSVSVDLVGQEVLRFFRLTFDQRNDLVRFERPDTVLGAPVRSASVLSTGYAVRPDTGWAEVIRVFRDDVAVRERDLILAMDGQAWRDRTCRAPRMGPVVDPVPDTVEILLLREGRELTVRSPRYVVHTR
ncbi:MAG TPA: hypothetical protein VJ925_07495 [Longimicrobiales bacterium]|nr:hypothetical protein [Longimicrobiales bacterium]